MTLLTRQTGHQPSMSLLTLDHTCVWISHTAKRQRPRPRMRSSPEEPHANTDERSHTVQQARPPQLASGCPPDLRYEGYGSFAHAEGKSCPLGWYRYTTSRVEAGESVHSYTYHHTTGVEVGGVRYVITR